MSETPDFGDHNSPNRLEMDGTSDEHRGFAFDSLEAVRKKLLDLTARNTLLAYRFPKASCLRIIDELPDQIARVLVDGKSLAFLPVPEPTKKQLIEAGYFEIDEKTNQKIITGYPAAEEWAKYLGFNTSYDLPEPTNRNQGKAKHQDTNIQSLLYLPELEARLRNLRSKAQTAIEESGSNVLYLSLGYLEWYESRESDVVRRAPLYTIPIKLERDRLDVGKGVYRYKISVKDDGLLNNLTLSEKLATDFGLVLPAVVEDVNPEDYLARVKASLLVHQPRWRVRRQATISLLNFGKQVMYEDLNPAGWPESASIHDHAIIRKFFDADPAEAGTGSINYAPEHAIDQIEEIHWKFPLVFDADSSQHSALIDAIEGQNLVIEGPPGTGKSQTIANLIAASIANGKKVLFVAEKMAALEVVKGRLERASLGAFCLELHSHKANKQNILSDLESQLRRRTDYEKPTINEDVARFEDLKQKLSTYVDLINTKWKRTGLTLHEIFNKATRYREQYKINPNQLVIDTIDGESLTGIKRKELLDQVGMLAHIYDQVAEQAPGGDIARHYWYGVCDHELLDYQADELSEALLIWNEQLENLLLIWKTFLRDIGGIYDEHQELQLVIDTAQAIEHLPVLEGGELLDRVGDLSEKVSQFEDMVRGYVEIHRTAEDLTKWLKKQCIDDPGTGTALRIAVTQLRDIGAIDSITVEQLRCDDEAVQATIQQLERIALQFSKVIPQLPPALTAAFETTQAGLNEHQILTKLIDELPRELWRFRNSMFADFEIDEFLVQLSKSLEVLTEKHDILVSRFSLHRLPELAQLQEQQQMLAEAGLFHWLSSDWRRARKVILRLASDKKNRNKELLELVSELVVYKETITKIESLCDEHPDFADLYEGVATPIERHFSMRRWYKNIQEEYGIGFGDRVGFGKGLLELNRNLATSISDLAHQDLTDAISGVTQVLDQLQERYKSIPAITNKRANLTGGGSPLETLRKILSVSSEAFSHIRVSTINLGSFDDRLSQLDHFEDAKKRWRNTELVEDLVPGRLSLSVQVGEHSQQNLRTAVNTLKIARVLSKNPTLRVLIEPVKPERYINFKTHVPTLVEAINLSNSAQETFVSLGKVSIKDWTERCGDHLESLIERNRVATDNPKWLPTWQDYIRLKEKLSSNGLHKLLAALERRDIRTTDLSEILQLVLYHQLATEALRENQYLASFSGLEQTAIRAKFQEYDHTLQELQRRQIAFDASRCEVPVGISSGRVSNYTDASLILHEANKKSRHVAIRSLMNRAGGAIQAVKPCFMMSPMSVAQYLQPGRFSFDLVIMDEASQIRPEDAIGAIARGSSLVVVGDPKQLPPTSFFHRVIEEDEDADSVALEDSESILETVIPMFKNRRLRWHYRSKHESLIAFSNQHFYESSLVLFPSPFQESDEYGIRSHRVNRGRFVNRRNVEEAREVVHLVANHLVNSDESVAIVAMNSEQRDEIERQMDQLVKDEPILRRAYERNLENEEPLIIKNLENVQGDERDVVVISMTYGPEQVGGRTMQRFGPINSDVGWRRLNVLFTRSKKRMHIFSSMSSSDILIRESSKRGPKALRAFLEYCESGHLHHVIHTGKPAESDFEIAVMSGLVEYGYSCEPQLGVAGFFLDLAVRDPGNPGAFLLGIECDGASYHSAKSARDRDVLRQEILESLGWKIRRIWSTDWFKNPQAQLQPILKDLEQLSTPVSDEVSDIPQSEQDGDTPEIRASFAAENVQQLESHDESTLHEKLSELDSQVIRIENPSIDEDRRLLRPAMLEALHNHLPCSKAEFLEVIPAYLRTGTDPREGRFLDQVLQVIAEYG